MNNFHIFLTMFLQVFSQQSSVAVFWSVFTAKEARPVKLFYSIVAKDISSIKHICIYLFVFRPRHVAFVPFIKQFFGWSKVDNVSIWDMAYFFYKKSQVTSFGKSCQLTTIAYTNIDQLFYVITTKQIKKLFCAFLCKTYSKQGNHNSINFD